MQQKFEGRSFKPRAISAYELWATLGAERTELRTCLPLRLIHSMPSDLLLCHGCGEVRLPVN
jgi:hypothetical protein